tara:strand:- start:128 stop:535 length:408 start_codon:yes stop_codon:yes gene_type:complete
MVCYGALVFERISLKGAIEKAQIISILIADVIYGMAGIAILISGILRVKYYGQGGDFYTHNSIFWTKIILFICVGLLSLYPTYKYITWAIPLSKGNLPEVSISLLSRLRLIITVELIGFSLIPLFATLMARGVGA